MPNLRLRDRDAITTKEGLIFRVFGYSHPSNAFVCDVEYAPSTIFRSNNPKAFRSGGDRVFYKFYEDEGLKFVQNNFSQYLIFHEMLQKRIVGVNNRDIVGVRKPEEELRRLVGIELTDELVTAMQDVLELAAEHSGLSAADFGVFGSMLCGFHHPKFSDIDLIIYGKKEVARLRETLQELYKDDSSLLRNEFETNESVGVKRWQFRNFTLKEFVWHQRRKLVYALFHDDKSDRVIKTEFEPVKNWKEITNEYDPDARIVQKGWVKMIVRITRDDDAPFVPSVYEIDPMEVLHGDKEALEAERIVSYVEEFRMQACSDETVLVEGNLEKVETGKGSLYQVALTYCPRYYEQALKVAEIRE